jgi:hypothetical protein
MRPVQAVPMSRLRGGPVFVWLVFVVRCVVGGAPELRDQLKALPTS